LHFLHSLKMTSNLLKKDCQDVKIRAMSIRNNTVLNKLRRT
jgi:hypothetical protein